MTLLHLIRARLRDKTIRRLEQDIEWSRASSDAHIRELESRLHRLRAEQDPRSSQEVVRDIDRRAKGVA